MLLLERTKPNGSKTVLIINDDISLSLSELERQCKVLNDYLVRQGTHNRSRYFVKTSIH